MRTNFLEKCPYQRHFFGNKEEYYDHSIETYISLDHSIGVKNGFKEVDYDDEVYP